MILKIIVLDKLDLRSAARWIWRGLWAVDYVSYWHEEYSRCYCLSSDFWADGGV